jgi:Flp pilus assembly protein TadG
MTHPSLDRRRSKSPDRGQALVEFALVVPILAVLLMSILQIGVLFFAQVGLTNAAREAARNASAIPVATSLEATAAANAYYGRLTNSSTGFLKRNVGAYSPGALVTTGNPRTQVCYYSFTDATGSPSIMAQVHIEYSHPLFIPLISQILDGFDGTNDGGFRIGVSEEIRVSNANLATTDIPPTPLCN